MLSTVSFTAPQLGQPFTEYRSRSFNRIGGPVITVTSFLVLCVGRQFFLHSFPLFLGLICLILFPFGLIITVQGIKYRGLRVVLCRDGFLFEQKGQTFPIQWQDVATVQEQVTRHFVSFVYIGKSVAYIVYTKPGDRIVLDGTIKDVRELGEKIQTGVALYQHAHPKHS